MNEEFHPLNIFKHCPRCGSGEFHPDTHSSMRCKGCGFIYFFNMATAVVGLIFRDDGKLLFTRRAHEPGKGMLDLPGGFVNLGETAETALKREMLEELNIETEIEAFYGTYPNLYLYEGIRYETLDIVFRCKASNIGNIAASDDVSDFEFHDPNTLKYNDVGLNSIKLILSDLQNLLR